MSVYGADTSVSRWRARWPADTVGRVSGVARLRPGAAGARCIGIAVRWGRKRDITVLRWPQCGGVGGLDGCGVGRTDGNGYHTGGLTH